MSSLGVVSDLVIGFVSKPVGKRPVLSLRLGQSLLHQKCLVSTHMWIQILQLNNQLIYSIDYLPILSSITFIQIFNLNTSHHFFNDIPKLLQFLPMSSLELQRLYRQNEKLKHKLNEQNTSLDCLNSNVDTHTQIITKQKNQIADLKLQIKILKRKMEEEHMEKERVQNRYILVLQALEEQLEQYKKKYLKLQNKIVPLMDHDSVRLKVLNQVQGNHHLQINNLKTTIDTLKDQTLKLRRQNQILKHSLENQRVNHQQQMRRKKMNKNNEFAQDTINYLTFSMWKDMEAKLKNSYEQARKQAQFYKQKYFTAQKKYQNRLLSPDRQDYQNQRI